MPLPTINVTVYSDLACPWCWVGYRRLSKAMDSFAGRARVEPEWRAYLLDPHFPEQAKDIKVALTEKFGRYPEQMMERLHEAGKDEGAPFAGWKWRADTIPGHMLVAAARKAGKSHEANRLLFDQAFEKGAKLNDEAVLNEAARALGLGDSAEAVIGSSSAGWDQALRREVLSDDAQAKGSLRVSGVPFFILQSGSSRAYGLSGAQPSEAFEEVFERVLAEGGGANGTAGSTGEENGGDQGAADGCEGGSCGMRGAGKE